MEIPNGITPKTHDVWGRIEATREEISLRHRWNNAIIGACQRAEGNVNYD